MFTVDSLGGSFIIFPHILFVWLTACLKTCLIHWFVILPASLNVLYLVATGDYFPFLINLPVIVLIVHEKIVKCLHYKCPVI